jgi:hypothetical protein
MPTSLVSTGVQFPDNTIQTTASGGYNVLLSNTFTSSGTYNKSSGTSNDTVVFTVVGGGGGGGAGFYTNSTTYSGAGGGGGGGYITVALPYDVVPSTVAITVGAGGAAGTVSARGGATGGTSKAESFAEARGGVGGNVAACTAAPQILGTVGNGGTAFGGRLGNANTFVYAIVSNFGIDTFVTPFLGARGTDSACSSPLIVRIFSGETGGGGSAAITDTGGTVTFLNGGTGRGIGDGGNSLGASGGTGAGGAANVAGTAGAGGDGIVIVRVVSGAMSADEYKRRSNTHSGVTVSY